MTLKLPPHLNLKKCNFIFIYMNPEQFIESYLFYKGSAVTKKQLAKIIGCSEKETSEHLQTLSKNLSGRGVSLLETETEVQLTTSPEAAHFLQAVKRDEFKTEIGKAGAETLAIILYKEPVSRAVIDNIRGVNSAVTIRNLLARGLIEKSTKKSIHGFTYTISTDLLSHLGITHKKELPEYDSVLARINTFENKPQSKIDN